MEQVILVDKHGNDMTDRTGNVCTMEKMQAHVCGVRHRAVSVAIFNSQNKLLLQKRSGDKYHSPEKWSNTCCTHPRPGEQVSETARRRLREEMGLDCDLFEAFTFSYRAGVGNNLIEDEYDHMFIGYTDDNPAPDPAEVSNWRWASLDEIDYELKSNPESYSVWFRSCFSELIKQIQS